tara:strand:- start:86 stop:766 length:681 start_codon:yes stop_codon:yes gene_type:complete
MNTDVEIDVRKSFDTSNIDILQSKISYHRIKTKEKIESWTDSHEKLLKEWSDKCAGYRWLHLRSHEMYTQYNNYLAYPIMIMSCIIGVGGLSSISRKEPTDFEITAQYIFFTCNIFVSILSSIQRFNGFMEKSERHSQASIQYSKIYRTMNMETCIEKKDRQYFGIEFCKNCKNEFDRLLSSTPEIPSHIITKFNHKFKHVVNKPDVANGLTHLENLKCYEIPENS